MAQLKKWTRPEYYMGETYEEYYPVIGQHRDSDDLAQSNFASMLKTLGGESDTVIIARASHWAVGWVESLMIHETDTHALELAQVVLDALDDYPVIDEEDYSQRQWQHAIDVWGGCFNLKERVELCVKYGCNIFAARHVDTIPNDENGRLFDYLTTD